MLGGHLVATLGAALLLVRGEEWCWALVARTAQAAYAAPLARPTRRRARAVIAQAVRMRLLLLTCPDPSRGPPLTFA
jgi:hypothetical protein